VDFAIDDDVLTLVDAIAEFFERRGDRQAIVEGSATSRTADRARWTALCEMGLPVLRLPEPDGIGADLLAATAVAEKLGAVLIPEPAVPTMVLASAWSAHGPSVPILDALCDGSRITALCGYDAVELSDGTVNGRVQLPDDDVTDAVALLASGDTESAIVVFDAAQLPAPVSRTVVDPTRPSVLIDLDGAAPLELLPISDATARRTGRELALLTVAELVGGMQKVLEATTDYVKTREQFGRPIGSFQAVKHRLADMYIATEQARATVQFAAVECTAESDTAAAAVASAARWVPRAAIEVFESAIRAHGAMGYSWETGVHLHLRRALATQQSFVGSKLVDIGALSSLSEAG
jgi:hypothetical protein